MPFIIVRQDITKMEVDAIVNAANSSLSAGGGVCGSIHRAAGPGLERECLTLGGCATGDAKATSGYDLPAKHVIHTVGPVWKGGVSGEATALTSCYRRSLEVAAELECESVAFPLISSGIFGYPKKEAFRVAETAIREFLTDHDLTVYLAIFSRDAVDIGQSLYKDIRHYIDDNYVKASEKLDIRRRAAHGSMSWKKSSFDEAAPIGNSAPMAQLHDYAEDTFSSLEGMLQTLDESFSEMLLRLIDERKISDVECYKRANIDRKLFSKIRSDPHYRPSKLTVLAFAVALELTLHETRKFLESAGFALSRSNKCDVIIEYFISRKNYNIFEINEALFSFDEPTLGNLH